MSQNLYKKLYNAIKNHSNLCDESIKDAARYGADAGFSGFIYYAESSQFFLENKEDIWELLYNASDDSGMIVVDFIAGFNRANMTNTLEGFECLLSWFALEEVGHWLLNQE